MVTDLLGNSVNVGDYISYAVRISNSPYVKIGIVLEVNEAEDVYDTSISVFSGETNKYRWNRETRKREEYFTFTPQSKSSKLSNLNRVIVLAPETVPQVIKDTLAEYIKKK